MAVFSVGGATLGIAEETLPFIPTLVLLARRLGYDGSRVPPSRSSGRARAFPVLS
jgi:hypothetical protein